MNLRKILAAMLVLAMLLASVACLAETLKKGDFVNFKHSAYGYKTAGLEKKSNVMVRHGSIGKVESTKGKFAKVYLNSKLSLWFETSKLAKETKSKKVNVVFSAGGEGHSAVKGKPESYKTSCKKVLAKGKCHIRKEPCLDGKNLGAMQKGTTLQYLGKRCVDDRGVYWYKVKTLKGATGWVSSVYTKPVK